MRRTPSPARALPILLALAALVATLAASPAGATTPTPSPAPPLWLDQPLANWNRAGAPVPAAPPAQGEPATSGRCRIPVTPSSAEEQAVAAAGWSLYKASDRQGGLVVVHANVAVDGMCRPWQYQAFVFAGGTFAGTLSPVAMNARTDGALTELTIAADSRTIAARYQRYAATDPLCCPTRSSTVTFAVDATAPLVTPTQVATAPNAAPSPAPAPPGLPNTGAGWAQQASWPLAALIALFATLAAALAIHRQRPS